jgi:ribose/xylose/arabinose/galactoside ABC-type transport system permease subunit
MIMFLAVFYIADSSLLNPFNLKILIYIAVGLLAVGLGQASVILTGGIDLSVGGIISMLSVVVILMLPVFGYFSFLVGIIIAGIAGMLNGLLVTNLRIPSFIVTLGMGGFFVSLTYIIHAAPMTVPTDQMMYLDVFNGSIGSIRFAWIWALILCGIYYFIQKYTYLGRTIYAVGCNEKMSWMSGINIKKTKIWAFTLSGIASGIAGMILACRLYTGSAEFGADYVLESVAVVVVGGIPLTGGSGNAINVLVGAIIMAILKNGLTIAGVEVMAQQSILGALIILSVALTFDRSKISIVK